MANSDGQKVSFWHDAWVPDLPNYKIKTLPPGHLNELRVADVLDHRFKSWDRGKLQSLVSFEEVQAILKIPLPVLDREDELIWYHDSKGRYTVKSGYQVGLELQKVRRKEKGESIIFFSTPKTFVGYDLAHENTSQD